MISMLIHLKLAVIFMTYGPCFIRPWRLDSLVEYREQRGTVFFFRFHFFGFFLFLLFMLWYCAAKNGSEMKIKRY